MKKLYHTEDWKRHSRKKSLKALRKKQKEKKLRKKRKNKKEQSTISHTHIPKITRKRDRTEITSPSNFSLINNIEETIGFFNMLDHCITEGKDIFINLEDVKELTSDAIMYTLSRIDYNRSRNPQSKVGIYGNKPKDEKCNRVFETSGFYNFVYSSHREKIQTDPNVYSIRSDARVFSPYAKEICDFTKKCFVNYGLINTKAIYPIIIECMANTNNHAYKTNSYYRKWWLMASFLQSDNKVHFTFIDNGFSIPSTIRMKWREHVQKLKEKIFTSIMPDSQIKNRLQDSFLIESALKGEFRTRTKVEHRGKGLPKIYETAQNQKIDNLKIISKRGSISVNNSSIVAKEIEGIFYGTLLSWDVFYGNSFKKEAI